MVMLRICNNGKRQQGRNKNRNQKASWPKVEQMGPRESICGSNPASDMLMWLKGLALDPCEPEELKDSVRKFRNRTLKLRNIWRSSNAECPQRKRKLGQILRGKLAVASGLASENTNYQNVRKLNFQQTVRNSCSSDSVVTFDNISQGKQPFTDSNASDNTTNWDPFNTDISSLVNTYESVNCSNLFRRGNVIVQDHPLVDSSDLISSSHLSSSEEKLQQAAKVLITDSESESENVPRAVIPIGPKFQAELPVWIGTVDNGNLYGSDSDSETLKWLGTKIWPIKEKSPESGIKNIGRGRPDSCSCVSPGSADCLKCHLLSSRHNLQSELGPAFLSWKFDEMGEVVSKKWTLKEQNKFESLVKNYLLSNETNFWECVLKCFRSKNKKSILSYYYNVFIPRRMSRQTRSSLSQVDSDEDRVDSDEDQVDGDKDEGHNWRNCLYKHRR